MSLPGSLMALAVAAAIVAGIMAIANTALEQSRITELFPLFGQFRQGTLIPWGAG